MTIPRTFDGMADLEKAVGTHLGHSDWHTISQEQIDTFAHATGDHQWIHVDPEKAAQGPFGTTIAHGYLTLSLLPMLCWEVYELRGVRMSVNYGANKVRFPAPVPVGSRVRAGVELLEVTPGSGGYQVVTRITIELEGGDKPVCVADTVTVVVP
ncbi:MaoC family dehydratase [Streptomyces sp. NRRL B-24572]|uniref:MaoC family dehydratase n=1 Tax=Streptomyces sp. NRRL B-24572 TaxID=1962156 RepID=UPI001C4F620D|nr:MaoC family dehydratase [Streptomyces sp. NRRL B-24572]